MTATRRAATPLPNTGNRRAEHLVWACWAGAWIAAGWFADPRTWGVHALAFLPHTIWGLAALTLAAVAVPGFAARVGRVLPAVAARFVQLPLLLPLLAAALIVFVRWRLAFQFLGDGNVWLEKLSTGSAFHHFEPLAAWVVGWTSRLGSNPALGAAVPSFAAGIVWIVCAALIARREWPDTPARGLALIVLAAHPTALLFFGYVESYPLLLAFQAPFVLVLLSRRRTRRHLLAAAALAGAATAVHLQAVTWLPALAWYAAGPRAARTSRSARRNITLALATSAVSTLVCLLAVHAPVRALWSTLGSDSAFGGAWLGRFLAPRRAIDAANEIALLLSPALVLCGSARLRAGRWTWPQDARWRPVAGLFAGSLVFAAAVPAVIGGARDWDLYAAMMLPGTLLALETWRLACATNPRGAEIPAGRIIVTSAVILAGWLGTNLSSPRAASRMVVLQEPQGPFGGYARAYANETLGIYFRDRDDRAAGAAYERAAAANPKNPRYWNNLATVQMNRGDIPAARSSWRRAYDLGYREWFVVGNMVLAAMRVHDCEDAQRLAGELVARDGARWQAWAMRGKVLLSCGNPGAAVPDLEHALQLEPNATEVRANLARAVELAGAPGAHR